MYKQPILQWNEHTASPCRRWRRQQRRRARARQTRQHCWPPAERSCSTCVPSGHARTVTKRWVEAVAEAAGEEVTWRCKQQQRGTAVMSVLALKCHSAVAACFHPCPGHTLHSPSGPPAQIVSAWQGMTISAFATAARVLPHEQPPATRQFPVEGRDPKEYLQAALKVRGAEAGCTCTHHAKCNWCMHFAVCGGVACCAALVRHVCI